MTSKLSSLRALYTALGGSSETAATLTSEIGAWNAILALGEIEGKEFISDAIAAVAENFALIDPSPAATLIEKTVSANGTYNATSDSANGYSSVTVNVPAGSEPFAVTITNENSVFTADKTYSETAAAIHNGDAMSFTFVAGGDTVTALGYFIMLTTDDEDIMVVLNAEDTSTNFVQCLKWRSNDTFELATYSPSNA